MARRATRAGALSLLLLGASAPTSQAWTADVASARLTIQGAPGEANRFSVAQVSGSLRVTDLAGHAVNSAPLPTGCNSDVPSRLICSGVSAITVLAGDRDDTVTDASGLAGSVLSGGSGSDALTGGLGDDELNGGDGDDTVFGGGGADTINGGAGLDQLHGGAGTDTLLGGDDDDQLYGDNDRDILDAGAGADVVVGGTGDDVLNGGVGADELDGEDGADQLNGGDGDDVLGGGPGNDALDGGLGADDLRGRDGNDALLGGDGDDRLAGDDGIDALDGEAGADNVLGGLGADVLLGGDGDDSLDGGADGDQLDGGAGADALVGGLGADTLAGGPGRDGLSGGDAADDLRGGDDNDTLNGGAGDDSLSGNDGNDLLDGGLGADRLDGGAGIDTADYAARLQDIAVRLGTARGDGELGEDDDVTPSIERILGGYGDDHLEAAETAGPVILVGGLGDDRLIGSSAADELKGGDGNDELLGGAAADLLDGGAGDDTLTGGPDADLLEGGDGDDLASYAERTASVIVTLDGLANDGEPGELDLVRVENVRSGSGADLLVGGRGSNVLDAGAGDDHLVSNGDLGSADALRCGAGNDRHDADEDDAVGEDCETDIGGAARKIQEELAAQELEEHAGVSIAATSLTLRRDGARWRIRVATGCRERTKGWCRVRLGLVVGSGKRPVTLRWTELTVAPGSTRIAQISVSAKAMQQIRALSASRRRTAMLRVLSYDAADGFERQTLQLPLLGRIGL